MLGQGGGLAAPFLLSGGYPLAMEIPAMGSNG